MGIFIWFAPDALACESLSKVAINELLSTRLDREFASALPDFQIHFDHNGISILRPYLGDLYKRWYTISVSIPKSDVDPLYAKLAVQLGHDVTLGGGSDLIEVGLLRTGKQASLSEINLVMDKKLFADPNGIETLWQDITISAPAFRGRPALINQAISVNGESGLNIGAMAENTDKGRHLIEDFFPLSVPFKHGHAVVIKADGTARLFFRTIQDLENYAGKVLTVPDEANFPRGWHLEGIPNRFLVHGLKYHLSVYARAKPLGWRYSQTSKELILSWTSELRKTPARVEELKNLFFKGALQQGVSASTALEIWHEFGF